MKEMQWPIDRLYSENYIMTFKSPLSQSSFDSSVGRAVDCSWHCKAEIHRSLVQIRLEGDFFSPNPALGQCVWVSLCFRLVFFIWSCFYTQLGSTSGIGLKHNEIELLIQHVILGSIVVSIPACHAGDRGSIPRRGGFLFSYSSYRIKWLRTC